MRLYNMDFSKLSRFERVNFLKEYGINTAVYSLLPRDSLNEVIEEVLRLYGKISYRCQSPTGGLDFGYPRAIGLNHDQAYRDIVNHVTHYDVMVAETIDIEYVTYNGNIAFCDNEIIVEVLYGSGTLDKLTREGHIDQRWQVKRNDFREIGLPEVRKTIKDLFRFPFTDIVVECSFFCKPVGNFGQSYIAWEVTNWGGRSKYPTNNLFS